jgi:hypothetical protein
MRTHHFRVVGIYNRPLLYIRDEDLYIHQICQACMGSQEHRFDIRYSLQKLSVDTLGERTCGGVKRQLPRNEQQATGNYTLRVMPTRRGQFL